MNLSKETMIRSYNNISFSPERRGESDFNHYTQLLAEDLKLLGENPGNYERKFIQRVMMIYHRQARCASPMIAGPANFPFRSNSKRNDSQRRAEDDFSTWRKKYIQAATRERTLSPEEEIDKALADIDRMEERKEHYKAANKLKTIEERRAYLKEVGYFEERDRSYMDYGDGKFPGFCITSLTLKIKSRKEKLDTMRARVEVKKDFQPIQFEGGYITLDADRVIIIHAARPAPEIITALKSRGFRWSPRFGSWSRKHTAQALMDAKSIVIK